MLHTEIRRPADLSAADRGAWIELCKSHQALRSPLVQPGFMELVASVRSDVAVLVARKRGAAVAFLPFHARPGAMARPIGAPFSDVHAIVCSPDIGASGPEILRSAGLKQFAFTALYDPFGLFAELDSEPEPSLVIEVPAEAAQDHWQAKATEERRHVKKVRRWREQLEADYGPVTLRLPDHDIGALHKLLAFKRAQLRRTGLHDFLGARWTQALMDAVLNCHEGQVHGLMYTLYAGDRLVAGRLGVRTGGVLRTWISSYDPAFASYGPGHLLFWEFLAAMGGAGIEVYELGIGAHEQKSKFATGVEPLIKGGWRIDGAASLARRTGPLARLSRRLDQIAVVELDPIARARGLVSALASAPRRLRAA